MNRSILFIALSVLFLASCKNSQYKEGMTVTSFSTTEVTTADGSVLPLKPKGLEGATTIVLVRHAEKGDDGTPNPPLTQAGLDRADKLAALVRPMDIQEVFMTNYKRVIHTARPLAQDSDIPPSIYSPEEYDRVIEKIFKKRNGQTVIIYGHSNTTPEIINLITGNTNLETIPHDEYDNIYVVNSMGKGKESAVWKFKF